MRLRRFFRRLFRRRPKARVEERHEFVARAHNEAGETVKTFRFEATERDASGIASACAMSFEGVTGYELSRVRTGNTAEGEGEA